jgi:flavin-dependent dehydrogenase
VVVCGAGPAGLAVASRVAASGLSVIIVDPDPLLNFIPTYGVWIDEFEAMGFGDCFEYTWEKAVVYLDSKPNGTPDAK